MIRKIQLWWYRIFKILSTERANVLKLTWSYNVHGDYINRLNCRSIWKDSNGNEYRVKELYTFPISEDQWRNANAGYVTENTKARVSDKEYIPDYSNEIPF